MPEMWRELQVWRSGLQFPVNASQLTLLSDAERFRLSEVLVDQNSERIPVVIGVAATSQEIAAKCAKHANMIGTDSSAHN